MAVNGDYMEILNHYSLRISACSTSSEFIKLRREAARKAIRSTNILRDDVNTGWPVNLEAYAHRLQSLYPNMIPEIQCFLKQVKETPTVEHDFLKRLIAFVDWMGDVSPLFIK